MVSDEDRRVSDSPTLHDLKSLLNAEQQLSLRKIEQFGWELAFVRRPMFENAIPVVSSPSGDQFGILDSEGELDLNIEIRIRRH